MQTKYEGVITLSVRSFGNSDAIGAASKLISVAWTAFVVRSSGRRETIWAAFVGRVLAAAPLVTRSTRRGGIIWATAESCVLAATTVEIGSTCRQHVVRAALVRCRQAATLSARSVCGCDAIVAATVSAVLARHMAAIVVWPQSYQTAIVFVKIQSAWVQPFDID